MEKSGVSIRDILNIAPDVIDYSILDIQTIWAEVEEFDREEGTELSEEQKETLVRKAFEKMDGYEMYQSNDDYEVDNGEIYDAVCSASDELGYSRYENEGNEENDEKEE